MALSFHYGDIKNWEEVCFDPGPDGKMKAVTEALIWATITVGINRITPKNWQKFYKRIYAWERAICAQRILGSADVPEAFYFTPKDIRGNYDLSTNADANTGRQFEAHLLKTLRKSAEEELDKFLRLEAERARQSKNAGG